MLLTSASCPPCCAAAGSFYYTEGSDNNTFVVASSGKLPIALGALSSEDTTYILGTVAMKFDDAQAYCAAHGGHLASWGALEEQSDVENYFQHVTGYMMQGFFTFYWFGLRVGGAACLSACLPPGSNAFSYLLDSYTRCTACSSHASHVRQAYPPAHATRFAVPSSPFQHQGPRHAKLLPHNLLPKLLTPHTDLPRRPACGPTLPGTTW